MLGQSETLVKSIQKPNKMGWVG